MNSSVLFVIYIYIYRTTRGVHLGQDNLYSLQSGKKNFMYFFDAFTSFSNVDINKSIVDEKYRSSCHSLTETDPSTMNLSIYSCNLSKEYEALNLVNEASNKFINETFPNLLFKIKKLRTNNPNKIKIGNLNINSLPNKFEQLKDIVM